MEVLSCACLLFVIAGAVSQNVDPCSPGQDTEPPTCPSIENIIRKIPMGTGGTTVTWREPFPTDNCDTITLIDRSHEPGIFYNTGSFSVMYVFEDASGNQATCSFTILITEGELVTTPSSPIADRATIPSTTSRSSSTIASSLTFLVLVATAVVFVRNALE
ncbi:hyalin-like [Amphiura filiformis]|uniref:hyalin-like n=1 Tax=Amphiura filiformis TaxID=82378 RepID=UPI003B21E552